MRRAPHFHPEYISIPYEDTVSLCYQPSTSTVLKKKTKKNTPISLHPFLYILIIRLVVPFADDCSGNCRDAPHPAARLLHANAALWLHSAGNYLVAPYISLCCC